MFAMSFWMSLGGALEDFLTIKLSSRFYSAAQVIY